MSSVHELAAADLRRSRLHLFWIQVLFTVAVGFLVIAEMGLTPEVAPDVFDRFPLGSLPYLMVGLQITAIALIVAVWFVPMWTLAWTVPVAWLLPYGASEVTAEWRALSLACLVVLVWMVLRSRRAVPGGPRRRLSLEGAFEQSWAFHHARLGWLAILGGLVVAAGLLVAHQVMLVQAQGFEDRAERAVVEVVSYDDEYYEMVVRLGDREITTDEPEWWEQPAVGDSVPVLVDPEDPDHVAFLASLPDPSWLFGLAAAAPLAGLWFGLPIILRARRSRELIAHGAPATMVRLACSHEGDFRLLPTDGEAPILQVVHLSGVVPRKDVVAFINDWDARFEPADEDPEEHEPESLPESDAVLAGWADDMKNVWRTFDEDSESPNFPADMPEDEKLMAEADFGPDVRDGEPFVLLGSWSHGSTVALMRGSGQVWLADIKEPRFLTGSQPVLPWKSSGGSSQRSSARRGQPAATGFFDRLGAALFAWADSNVRWLRWAVAVGAAVVAALFVGGLIWVAVVDDGGGFFAWIRPVVIGVVAMAVPSIAMDWVSPATTGRTRLGLASHGLLLDETVARDRLVSVVAGEDAIAVRLKDPDDALAVFPEDVGRDLEPEQAADQVRLWFAAAPADGRSGRRPSPILVAGVLQIILTAAFALWFLG